MDELELLGLHSDGEHLTLTDRDGQRYRLLIDDALRAAVRRDRQRMEQLRTTDDQALRPREIQVLVRAGASAEEVAAEAGLPVEHVRRYEGPVLAERSWAVQQAKALRISHESDAPELGDLVVDRLASRGVDTRTLAWDAVRAQGEPWEVAVTFVADGKEHEARWRVDLSARSVHAVDEESRWLSETEVGPGPVSPRRRLTAVGSERRSWVYDLEADPTEHPAEEPAEDPADDVAETDAGDPAQQTDDILAELAAQRGTRVQPDLGLDDDEDDDAPWDAGAHPPASRPDEARDAHVLPLRGPRATSPAETDDVGTTPALPAEGEEEAAEAVQPAPPRQARAAGEGPSRPERRREAEAGREPSPRPRKNRRTTRRSVPSWDEIVFGARPE